MALALPRVLTMSLLVLQTHLWLPLALRIKAKILKNLQVPCVLAPGYRSTAPPPRHLHPASATWAIFQSSIPRAFVHAVPLVWLLLTWLTPIHLSNRHCSLPEPSV